MNFAARITCAHTHTHGVIVNYVPNVPWHVGTKSKVEIYNQFTLERLAHLLTASEQRAMPECLTLCHNARIYCGQIVPCTHLAMLTINGWTCVCARDRVWCAANAVSNISLCGATVQPEKQRYTLLQLWRVCVFHCGFHSAQVNAGPFFLSTQHAIESGWVRCDFAFAIQSNILFKWELAYCTQIATTTTEPKVSSLVLVYQRQLCLLSALLGEQLHLFPATADHFATGTGDFIPRKIFNFHDTF